MKQKRLARDLKLEALARMEDAARTEEDFKEVVEQWDHLDKNEERRVRDHEKQRDEKAFEVGYKDGAVFPIRINHPSWRESQKGDFLSMIFDNAADMWQIIEDQDIAEPMKNLTKKQKEVLFFSEVRLCSSAQIACYQDKTDRAVRKLLSAALDSIREKLAPLIREQLECPYLESGCPRMTIAKREFLARYDAEKAALDSGEAE